MLTIFVWSVSMALVFGDCVVVTGATGFVASHVIEQLFQRGHVVHGTVRDPSNEKKTAFLRELEEKYDATLKLFKADLLEPNPFDLAVEGCSSFLHVASPVVQGDLENQQMLDSAVQGTLSALNAAQKSKVKTMIITSSVASISPSKAKAFTRLNDCTYPYNESDWNDMATLDKMTYHYTKVQAELATNEWLSKFDKPPFRLATVHFPLALGPLLTNRVTSSSTLLWSTITGEYPFLFPLYFNIVDIRDVARAHVHLLEHKQAHGRYIVSVNQHLSTRSWLDISNDILEAEDLNSLPVATFVVPAWIFSFAVWLKVDDLLTEYQVKAAYFGYQCGYDGTKITRELGFEYKYTDMKATIQDGARSMLRWGVADAKHHMVSIKTLLVGFVVAMVVFVMFLYWCCCRRSRKDKKD